MNFLKYFLATFGAALMGVGLFVLPANALTVDSLDCSGIDATDGNAEDWENIPYLINTDESVTGTTYYLENDGSWTITEPDDWRYSMNLEKQANIQQMKVCNTDTFFMLLNTEEPMMSVYDRKKDGYVDLWSPYDFTEDGDAIYFTLPDDFHYWMVWKMSSFEHIGPIIYFAADLAMDAGDVQDVQVPTLYLFSESDETATFTTAEFDANQDTELTTIDLNHDDPCDVPSEEASDSCEPDVIDKNDSAFEVSQDISELFNYTLFTYGETIQMSAAMYNSDEFPAAAGAGVFSLLDETDTKKYTFSKRSVTDLHAIKYSAKAKRITLTWDKLKNADSYQIKLINPNNDKVLDLIRGIDETEYKLIGLDAATTYRAIVRAVIRKNGKKTYSAWSSGYKWTTDSE